MRCYVYKGRRKPETYLYLTAAEPSESIPRALMEAFGELERVMELVLSPDRDLAHEDVLQVLRNLLVRGFHVQLPPQNAVLSLAERVKPSVNLH